MREGLEEGDFPWEGEASVEPHKLPTLTHARSKPPIS